MANINSNSNEKILAELTTIKRLLILALLNNSASQQDIANALGVTQSAVSQMFPKGTGKAARSRRNK